MLMKAIIIHSPGNIGMIEVEKPKAGPLDILIKVAYSGICGTDLAILDGDMSFVRDGLIRYPVRIGHEWSGIVEEVGTMVTDIRRGDRVVADNVVTCGVCEQCAAGKPDLCRSARAVGTVNCWDGSFAEYMLMPERHVYKLPDDISLEEAALIEPSTIALCGLKHCGLKADSSVLIIGTGPIGLAAAAIAKNMGVSNVMLAGRKQIKLDIGKKMGADTTVDVTVNDLKTFVLKNTDGFGADAVVETSGSIGTVNNCLGAIRPGGTFALIGFYETTLDDFPIDYFVLNRIHMIGIAGEMGLIPEVIDMMSSKGLDLMPMITHRYNFDEAADAIKTAKEKNNVKIKMMVKVARDKDIK
jgi:2-desacetyl-2-hydroxyethyl bacteriochlorophyllide A dehydrogenase